MWMELCNHESRRCSDVLLETQPNINLLWDERTNVAAYVLTSPWMTSDPAVYCSLPNSLYCVSKIVAG